MKKQIQSKEKNLINNINNLFNNAKEITIKITWRMYFFVAYLSIVMFLVINAILNHYENKPFAAMVTFIFIMSYMFSVFLIRKKEE